MDIFQALDAFIKLIVSLPEIGNNWNSNDPEERRMARLGCTVLIAIPLIIVLVLLLAPSASAY